MLYTTPGLSQYISGVILHVETLFQKDASGKQMVDLITGNGMIPGIKLDKGYDKSGLPGTAVGPLGHAETWCKGIDDLEKRCAEAYAQGARFAKWRNVLQIDPNSGLPSDLAIEMCVQNLAQYAAICQRHKLCPIVEPEIVPNGKHSIDVCAAVTEKVLTAQFRALALHNVYLEGAVLKPNMVKNGLEGPRASAEQVALLTVQALRRTVPAAMPGARSSARALLRPGVHGRARACSIARACLRACVPACLRACVPACLRACVPACLRACVLDSALPVPIGGLVPPVRCPAHLHCETLAT